MFDWFGKKNPQAEVSPGRSTIHRYPNRNNPEIGFVGPSVIEFARKREDAYLSRFGTAETVFHEVIPFIPHIDVMVHYRESINGKVCILVTSGMSDVAMNVPPRPTLPEE